MMMIIRKAHRFFTFFFIIAGISSEECKKTGFCDLCQKECSEFFSLASIRSDIQELKAANAPVAFYAYLSTSLQLNSVSAHQTIVYDTVDLNIGNGYDKTSGKFTAPYSGLYVFHVTTGTRDSSHAVIEVVQNGTVKDVTWADSMDHPDRAVATTATPMQLNKGDVVFARIGIVHGGSVMESSGYIRCSFSGFKLH